MISPTYARLHLDSWACIHKACSANLGSVYSGLLDHRDLYQRAALLLWDALCSQVLLCNGPFTRGSAKARRNIGSHSRSMEGKREKRSGVGRDHWAMRARAREGAEHSGTKVGESGTIIKTLRDIASDQSKFTITSNPYWTGWQWLLICGTT
jgi:hypothetical protein